MSIQIIGYNNNAVADVDGTDYYALKVTIRPVEYGLLGSYRVSSLSGTMAANQGNNFDLFQMRWVDATRIALVWNLVIAGLSGSATVFTAGFGNIAAYIARNWTSDGSGGAVITPTGDYQQLRTSMGTSIMGTVRGPTTAALGQGTRTLDAQSFALATFSVGVNANVNYINGPLVLFGLRRGIGAGILREPAILGFNEGIVIQGTIPGTGTWQVGLTATWSEVGIY
jgi:hypothetical protein